MPPTKPLRALGRAKPAQPDAGRHAPNTRMLEALGRLRVIIRAIKTHYHAVATRSGIGGAQLWALSLVAETPGMKVSELARHMAIHQSTASNLIERLVQQRLMQRRGDSEDQRIVHLHLTAAGRKMLELAPAPAHGVLHAALESLPADRLRALTHLLDEVIAALPPQHRHAKHQPLAEILGRDKSASQATRTGKPPARGDGVATRRLAAARSKSATGC